MPPSSRLSRSSLLILLLVAGCRTAPETADAVAARNGLARTIVEGDGFRHVAFIPSTIPAGDTLDLYIEGDGIPWQSRFQVSADPTPRHALALELMAEDPGPAVYLGRPCYFGLSADAGCTARLWTDGRYGGAVVGSMAAAAERLRQSLGARQFRLIGYSGGGVLAVLMAARLPETIGVVTIAANLDLVAWTAQHGYSPLNESIDPAAQAALPGRLRQDYFYGGQDDVVPVETAARYLVRAEGASRLFFPSFDHVRHWTAVWPSLIDAVRRSRPIDCGAMGCQSLIGPASPASGDPVRVSAAASR